MKTYFFAFLLLSQLIFAQKIPMEQVIQKFEKSQLTWEMPLNNKKVSVFWQERISTFSSEGIKTFVGYADNQMIGVISVQKNTISGSVRYLGKQFLFSTENNFFVIKKETIKDKCGVCEGEYCSASHSFPKNDNLLNISDITSRKTARLQIDDVPEIHSDGILRVYRLAILVDYNLFRNTAGSDVNRIKQFWAETETFLNELYIRDLSIKFEVVKDDRLIRKTIADRVFQDSQTPDEITNQATAKINDIIGEKSYDVGVVASSGRGGLNGIAALFLAYSKHGKAQAWVSVLQPVTVAHELGHLFGASHTYSEGGAYDSMNTEPRRGQSVMSYSRTLPRDFFSLPSINTIRKAIQNNADYYTDEARTNRVGPQNSENIVYGIPSNNQAPVINRSQLKSEYTLPQGTYFQFHIPATDPDGHSLRYMAHQADIRLKERFSFAIVRSAKPQADPTVIFYHQYYITDNQTVASVENAIPNFPITGNNNERTFWLGVSDAGALAQNPNHAVRYDMFPTKVKFVDGTAFKILTDVKKTYNAGEKITLRWGVDSQVFAGTKVKISMSDDFGQTWKYVLAPETPNDGSEEITIPHIELGRKQHAPTISSGLGLIKIEVIGHIAVAVSNNHPITGGFEIKKSEISFENLPPQFISVKQGEEPQKADVIAKTTCVTPSVSVDYKEEKQSETILARIWEANDTCGNTATFTQYIEVKKSVQPLRFVGELPQNVHIQCVSQSVENPQMLTVTGGTSPTISFTQTKLEGDYENYTLKRTWIATDPDADPISHTQIVVINDGEKPVLSAYPPSATVKSVEEMPQNPSVTATDNCDGNVEVEVTGYLEIAGGKNTYVNSWTAKDKSGNTVRHEQRITIDPNYVAPTTPPLSWVETSFPENKSVNCVGEIPVSQNPQTTGGKGVTNILVSQVAENQSCTNNYTLKRIYTAVNENEKITHTQTIVVKDKIAPTFIGTLPQNIEIFEDEVIPAQENLTATDNCGTATVTKTESRENGKVTYIWTAKDDCGNQVVHTQVITIKPRPVQPIVWVENSLPKNTKVSCENIPVIATNLQANGGCSTLTISHKSDEISAKICTNSYKITRIYEAKDNCGNSKMHTQTIEVEDVTKPTFVGTLPQNIEIFEDETIPAQENLTATDNCGTATVTKTETRESGKVTYIWTAKDDCGNQVVHTQIITIKPRPIQPIVWVENSLPKNENYTCRASVPAKSTDNLRVTGGQGNVKFAVSESVENEQCTNKVTIKRIFTASENSMQLTHTQIITVNDNEKPTFIGTLPQNIEIFEDETVPTQENLSATDNCGTATVTKTETRESGNVTYIWTAKDDCGNQVTHTQIITIKPRPVQPIVWVENSLPKNTKVSCENIPVIATNLQANGGCSTLTISHKSDEISAKICTNSYQIRRIYEAKDNCGNSKMHTQTIEVEDVTKPTFVGTLPQNIEIFEGENIPAQGNLTATDNCGTATVTKTETRESGKVTYIWTAKDDCGNQVIHNQIITLKKKENSEVPKNPEIPKNPNPIKNSAEMVIYNAISTENGSENYFRIENLSENLVVRVQIFSNLGEKVYESDTYGQNNMFFRGYSNVKDISNTEKLPEGVYYYLLWINNEPKPRKGYLYVR